MIVLEGLPLEEVSRAAHRDHHHRSRVERWSRAAVFGASDGLVSNVALILGVPVPRRPRASFAGRRRRPGRRAVSMAAGEYISMRSQPSCSSASCASSARPSANPELERLELAKIYESRGMEPELASELATAMMRDPEIALEVHAREELGIDPDELGSPMGGGGVVVRGVLGRERSSR
jgi:vacuolar iron transporter family protein